MRYSIPYSSPIFNRVYSGKWGKPANEKKEAGRKLNRTESRRAEREGLDVPVRYNERECILEINTEYSLGQVFAALATEISYARLHARGMNRDYDRGTFQLTAESVGFMVCRRFGVDCPVPDAAGVQQFYNYYTPDERGKSLDMMRQTARNMGETMERSIQPRQQEHNNSRNNNFRQYGRR